MRKVGFVGFVMSAWLPVFATGCADETTASDSAAIETMAEAATTAHAEARACFQAFDGCRLAAADDAAKQVCRDTLKACLPERPDRPPPPLTCDGRPPRRPPPPPGTFIGGNLPPPPPPGDGGELPPPPPDGLRPPLPCGGFGGEAGLACKTALEACVASGEAEDTCTSAAHDCMDAAMAANFAAACQRHLDHCRECASDDTVCQPIADRCAEGLPVAE